MYVWAHVKSAINGFSLTKKANNNGNEFSKDTNREVKMAHTEKRPNEMK